MLDGVELGKASEHDDWAWFAVVAGPAAEPCEDPCGEGERAGRVRVLLLGGFAFEALTDALQGRSVVGVEDFAERAFGFALALVDEFSTSCITLTAAIRMAATSFSSGPSCSCRSASTAKPFVFMVRNNCSIVQRKR